jgi:hypothetical protein
MGEYAKVCGERNELEEFVRHLGGDAHLCAKDFDLTETAVRQWVRQTGRDAGTGDGGLTSDERRELAELRRENRRLKEDVDILKRATAFFALRRPGELLPIHRRGKVAATQRQAGVLAAGGLQVRLLRSARGRAVGPGRAGRRAGRSGQKGARGLEGPLRLAAGPRAAARPGLAALPQASRQAHEAVRPAGPGGEALEEDHHPRPRGCRAGGPDMAGLHRRRLQAQHPLVRGHHPYRDLGRLIGRFR